MVATKAPATLAQPVGDRPIQRDRDVDLPYRFLRSRGTTIVGTSQRYEDHFHSHNFLSLGGDAFKLYAEDIAVAPKRTLHGFIPLGPRGLADEGFVSFDSTTVGGAPDPAWSLLAELGEALAEAKALISQMRALRAGDETVGADDGDAVVFGEPNRRVKAQGQKVRSRRGEPLILPGDLDE